MNANRNTILEQLAQGQITVDEAARLMQGTAGADAPAAPKADPAVQGRWLHVRVTNLETGKPKVNVNLPLSWVQLGMQIGARHSPEIGQIDFAEIAAMVQSGASGKLVEVEDLEDGERVEVYVD